MLDAYHVRGFSVAVLLLLTLTSCAPADPHPPWDTDEMVRQLTSDLRRFEGLSADLRDSVILAWRVDARPGVPTMPRIPLPDGSGFVSTKEDRVEVVLLWGRIGPANAPTGWVLMQGYRHPGIDTPWQRSLFHRYLRAPLTRLRPGEDADGTWHAYQRYNRPPTSQEACAFAEVDFLAGAPSWHRIAGGFRTQAWMRALGGAPPCGFPETRDANHR